MTREKSAHLTEESLNDLLIGLGSQESNAHLAVCPACRSRVEEFQSTMQAFNRSSLAWSEARPEARPATPLARTSRIKTRKMAVAPLGWALAGTAFLAIGLPVWNARHHAVQGQVRNQAVAPVASTTDSEAQIAQDNELLRSVNMALNSNEESPISEYHLLDRPHARAKTRPELRSQ
jgi:anti-sigma factor RsiW